MNLKTLILDLLEAGYELTFDEIMRGVDNQDWPEKDPTPGEVQFALNLLKTERWVIEQPRKPGFSASYRRRTARQRAELLAEQSGMQGTLL